MKYSAENYIPQVVIEKMRKQAVFVWLVSASFVAIWVFLILLAPIAEAYNFTFVSTPIYTFFGFLCHQMTERSFYLVEHSFAVCSRCFGVYFGLLFGFTVYPLLRHIENAEPVSRIWLFLALIPMALDWSLGYFEIWENTHFSRFSTGLILGTACAVFIIPALVEIFQLRLLRK